MVKSKSCCDLSKSVVCCNAKPDLRFQFGKNRRGLWYWHIRARNGEIIAQGEGYKRVAKIDRLFELLHDGAGMMTKTNLSPAIIGKPMARKRGFIG
jgi:uncharacterized protein YegP (UPF0339 family)